MSQNRVPRENPVIVALDFPDAKSTLKLLAKLEPRQCRAKVGKELFTRCGPDLVRQIMAEGFDVFLDLKFHDIPNTVAGAVSAAVDLGVWMVNVHASGGRAMLEAAAKAVHDTPTLLTAVTVLTSLSGEDLLEVGFMDTSDSLVLRLAKLAADCGIDGVVCSSRETSMLRTTLPSDFLLVTPGIRLTGDLAGDQKRIATPASAIINGSDYLVVGRPITRANDPQGKLQELLAEIAGKH